MSEPKIEITPMRSAVRSDGASTLDVLVEIIPPAPEVHFVRPPINLGLVLDRSGSMSAARKMNYACEAACFAVQQLLATDRVGVTIFDNEVETLVPNAPATDKPYLVRQIMGISPRNATALHAGWKQGGLDVERNFITEGMNRVILLSDGLANEGVTDPNVIAADTKALAARGVSTSTMGLGSNYNEDLMQAMAESGDGNYYYIESPQQLADIFHTEMNGLMANFGQKVSLGIEPQSGVRVVEVLNDLERNARGRVMLPNLLVGMPIPIVVRLEVPTISKKAALCRFRLAWDDPKAGRRRQMYAMMELGTCSSAEWEKLPVEALVAEHVALLMAARAKREAIAAYDQGNEEATRAQLIGIRYHLSAMASTEATRKELDEISELEADLDKGQGTTFRKRAGWQAYLRKFGKKS
ncbi:vWA domain-containing protein [Tundrisphaera lichenicola]|uniref:vWA domain-containing protein n=1 Tax=Tundrisphaera lichenicola TaxID=2029860 RepID=UPI003EB8E604